MIIDQLQKIDLYQSCIPFFDELKHYLDKTVLSDLPEGSHVIGSNSKVIIGSYSTKNTELIEFESHKEFIDIQIILSGKEIIGYNNIEDLKITRKYEKNSDITYYKNIGMSTKLVLNKGMFCIFFQNDGHQPGCKINDEVFVKKAVIKIRAK